MVTLLSPTSFFPPGKQKKITASPGSTPQSSVPHLYNTATSCSYKQQWQQNQKTSDIPGIPVTTGVKSHTHTRSYWEATARRTERSAAFGVRSRDLPQAPRLCSPAAERGRESHRLQPVPLLPLCTQPPVTPDFLGTGPASLQRSNSRCLMSQQWLPGYLSQAGPQVLSPSPHPATCLSRPQLQWRSSKHSVDPEQRLEHSAMVPKEYVLNK